MKPMMKCGHAANAICRDKPCCVICAPKPEAYLFDDSPPNLEGRFAHCAYAKAPGVFHGMKPSSTSLAFFEHRPDKPEDIYYCGCHGWD